MILVAVLAMFIGAIVFSAIVVDVWQNTPTGEGCKPSLHTSRQPRCRRHSRTRINH